MNALPDDWEARVAISKGFQEETAQFVQRYLDRARKEYLGGDLLCLADFFWFQEVKELEAFDLFDTKLFDKYPLFAAWYKKLNERDSSVTVNKTLEETGCAYKARAGPFAALKD